MHYVVAALHFKALEHFTFFFLLMLYIQNYGALFWFIWCGYNFVHTLSNINFALIYTLLLLVFMFMTYAENWFVCLIILLIYFLCICINSVLKDLPSTGAMMKTNQSDAYYYGWRAYTLLKLLTSQNSWPM